MARHLFDLDVGSVRLLLSVVELGSISKAATRHGLSQPTASRRVRELERRLGHSLLERTTAGASLSIEGMVLLPELRALARAAEDLHLSARNRELSRRPLVSIAMTPSVLRHDLPALLVQISGHGNDSLAGQSEFRLESMSTMEVCNAVRKGSVEVGFVDGPDAPLGLSSRTVRRVPLVVVVHPQHRWLRLGSPIDANELVSVPLLLPRPNSGTRDFIEATLRVSGSQEVLIASESGPEECLSMAAIGPHPAIVRQEAAHALVAAGLVAEVETSISLSQPIRLTWSGSEPSWLARLGDYLSNEVDQGFGK